MAVLGASWSSEACRFEAHEDRGCQVFVLWKCNLLRRSQHLGIATTAEQNCAVAADAMW
jgi:hypothetical protein